MAFRAFISVDVGDLIDWRSLREDLAEVDRGVRPVRADQFHLTLRFLGDTDEVLVDPITELMERSVEGIAPFEMAFEGVGAFPNPRRPRVIWIGLVGAEPLQAISQRLEDGVVELGFQPERRRFRPHATVARIKHVGKQGRLANLLDRWGEASFGSMRVEAIHLKRSELTPGGAIHTTLRTTRLRG